MKITLKQLGDRIIIKEAPRRSSRVNGKKVTNDGGANFRLIIRL